MLAIVDQDGGDRQTWKGPHSAIKPRTYPSWSFQVHIMLQTVILVIRQAKRLFLTCRRQVSELGAWGSWRFLPGILASLDVNPSTSIVSNGEPSAPGPGEVLGRDGDERRLLKLVDEVAGLEGPGLIVVRTGLPGEMDERQRRLCGERMFYDLQQNGVQNAVFESKTGRPDCASPAELTVILFLRYSTKGGRSSGTALITTNKIDDVPEFIATRHALGRIWIYDPTASTRPRTVRISSHADVLGGGDRQGDRTGLDHHHRG